MSSRITAVTALVLALTLWAGASGASTTTTSPTVKVKNVRLEAAPATETAPSAVLKFDLLNNSLTTIGLVKLRISVVEKADPHDETTTPRVLVRPFTVLGHIAFESGYTITYEMVLRHFAADCNCVPVVEVVSAESQPDLDSEIQALP